MSHYDRDPSTGTLTRTDGGLNLQDMKAVMLDICYPVGSIYQSTENVSPATFLGGTWISLSGYMLRGATSGVRQNNNANDGGADSQTISSVASHNHTQNSHNHTQNAHHHWHRPSYKLASNYGYNGEGNSGGSNNSGTANFFNAFPGNDTSDTTATNNANTATNNANGANYTVNTLPKYKNVYMWERTA